MATPFRSQAFLTSLPGFAQTQRQGFNFNGESDLDLQYAFGLTNPQPILLLQAGDLIQGMSTSHFIYTGP